MQHAIGDKGWHEECGVVGIWAPGQGVSELCYLSLFALQHRGQEGAGIAVTNGMHIDVIKDLGLMPQVFARGLPSLRGHCAVGHVRYSTIGNSIIANVQPIFAYFATGLLCLAHNGSLTNAKAIQKKLEDEGCVFHGTTDSEAILNLIAKSNAPTMEEKIIESLHQIEGAYCLAMTTGDKLIAIRDPNGFRPLCLGFLPSGGYIVASESCALDAVDAEFIRDILPGEMLVIDDNGLHSYQFAQYQKQNRCIFEYIYFARPDSNIDGLNVWQVRYQLGRQLAKEQKIDADIVVPVPDTGIAAAIGYSAQSGILYVEGLIKNRYIGRTFILPEQKSRANSVKMKLSPVKANLAGQRVILIDDSIVRGTTSARLIALLREAGAKEVHMCISSPPITHPCYYGIDTSVREDLISAKLTPEQISEAIGADSVQFLSLDGLAIVAQDSENKKMCRSCFTGCYPTEVSACINSAIKVC